MALTIPPDIRAVGTADPPGDMNNVADMLGLLTQTLAQAGGTVTAVNTTAVTAVQALQTAQTLRNTTFRVPPPTGATATDTPNVTAVITKMNTAGGGGTLLFADGTYQVDSNALLISNCSNFAVRGTGATVITMAPNRAGLVNNVTGNGLTISGCSDFQVSDLALDGLKDTIAPMTPLTASAASGQPSVTVAAGQGAHYLAGQFLTLFGGLGTAESNQADGFTPGGGGGVPLIISSITAGGGSGGGDLITFTTNLANTYAQISSTPFSDGTGPYAYAGAHLTPYQCGFNNSIAGRTLSTEDQQNGLHLINCTRFIVSAVEARNWWESPIKLGTGFEPSNGSLTSGCTYGAITDCIAVHAYDQGISVWMSRYIIVKGCVAIAAGWAGISLTASDLCSVVSNQISNSYYRAPTDNNSGSGIATEGGVQNQIKGNIIFNTWSDGIRLRCSPLGFGAYANSAKTTSTFLAAQTAAGTSVQLNNTTNLVAGAPYSLIDGARSEALTLATIVDGTHVTFTTAILYSHPAGIWLGERIDQENVIEGNTIYGPQFGAGITVQQASRQVIKNNSIRDWGFATGSIASGIIMAYSNSQLANTAFLGGDGSHIEGNTITGGLSPGISVHAVSSLLIRGNRIQGLAGTAAAMNLKGITDSLVNDNFITDIIGQGIILQPATGTRTTTAARVTITGNDVTRCSSEGIIVLTGDSLTIGSNVVTSCGGHAGIDLRGVSNSSVSGNVSNSNATAGIQLEDNGAVHSVQNMVTGNTTRDDGSGINVTTGAALTQIRGILESVNANNNIYTGNAADSNTTGQIVTVGAGSQVTGNIISGVISTPAAPVSYSPANPASTISATLVMMGLGSTCVYTPTGSGLVLVNVSGGASTLTSAITGTVGGRYGTGTAPVNGAAVTGARFGGTGDQQFKATGVPATVQTFALTAVLALTAGTAYWFDLALLSSNVADAAEVLNVSMSFAELPQ